MLSHWIEALVLGVVQGLTEFLPISSDGHLNLTQHAFAAVTGRRESEAEKIFFDVMLHVGTLVAILVFYRRILREGARGLLGATDVSPLAQRPLVIRVGTLAFVATLPLVLDKLFFLKWIEAAFQSLTATGVGFLITAAVLLLNLGLKGGRKEPLTTHWSDALLVGLAQMFAPLPGVSRSGLTIASALALGFSRTWAVGFSLLIVVPAILGATVFELADLRKLGPGGLGSERVAQIVVAASVAGLIGYFAIIWLIRLVQGGRLWYFSVYLLLLGLAVIVVDQRGKGGPDARPSHALDRTLRGGPSVAVDRAGRPRGVDSVAGAVFSGPRPDSTLPGPGGSGVGDQPSGLDLDRRLAGGRGGSRRPTSPAVTLRPPGNSG